MLDIIKKIFTPPALRINAKMMGEVVLLLSVSLAVMFYFSRKALKEEVIGDTKQTLEYTQQHIDNILLNVEQSAGNVYCEMIAHLDQPERMEYYCRKMLECNENVIGCAIAFRPYYYKEHELFMTYVHWKGGKKKKGEVVAQKRYGTELYVHQAWYTEPMETGKVCWTDPSEDKENDGSIISLCLPIYGKSSQNIPGNSLRNTHVIGVMAVDLPLSLLSEVMLNAKPSPNSYCILLGQNGSYIVHPNPQTLANKTVFAQAEYSNNPDLRRALEAMLTGRDGIDSFKKDGKRWFIFYKSFQRSYTPGRSMEDLNWSLGIVYLKADSYGALDHLFYFVLAVAFVSLLVFYMLVRYVTRRQLNPLRILTRSAKRMTSGHYDEIVPESKRNDEIGLLQNDFRQMQQSLAARVNELNSMTATLQERSKVLRKAYSQAHEADRMKTHFLHDMTNQMTIPSGIIEKSVTTLCNDYQHISMEEMNREVSTIKQQSDKIIELLDQMLDAAEDKAGKEATHE
jgi:methyl-accepting chemotaxis protein/sigma-B regulation protein RsbU (phosphoserine phosphatase)